MTGFVLAIGVRGQFFFFFSSSFFFSSRFAKSRIHARILASPVNLTWRGGGGGGGTKYISKSKKGSGEQKVSPTSWPEFTRLFARISPDFCPNLLHRHLGGGGGQCPLPPSPVSYAYLCYCIRTWAYVKRAPTDRTIIIWFLYFRVLPRGFLLGHPWFLPWFRGSRPLPACHTHGGLTSGHYSHLAKFGLFLGQATIWCYLRKEN